MKQNSIKLSEIEKKFINSLFQSASSTDSEIAKKIGVSKASVSRIKKKLQKEGVLVAFTPVVDFEKLDITLFATIIFEWKNFSNEKLTKEMEEWLVKNSHTILVSEGESVEGLNYMVYAGFRNIEDYHEYSRDFRKKYEESIGAVKVFFTPIKKILMQDYAKLVTFAINELDKENQGDKK